MEGENSTPAAAASATEANSTNDNLTSTQEAPAEPQKPAEPTPEQVANFFGTSVETLNDFKKFAESNGKFDKAFETFKSHISNPKPADPDKSSEQKPAETQPIEQPQQPAKPQAGHMTRDEFFALQYFNGLANDPKYKDVADKIRNGEAIKEMAKFGINAINGDDINDAQVRQFLDMYSKANAPSQPSQPVTNTPTVDYVDIKEVRSMADADEIMRQNIILKAQGKPLHPQTEAAKNFAKEFYKKK